VEKLFTRQLAKASKPSGEVDLDKLRELVVAAYDQSDRDRRRTDRSISLMIQELDQLNRKLEGLVEERTAALREREAQLRAQNLRFDAAVNNMSQALLMFDRTQRLVICNERYLRMYGLSAEIVRPGCTVRELLEHRRGAGSFSGNVEAYVQDLLDTLAKGATMARMVELPDGRTISVLNHPMADGGWVATHEDITERRRAERQIAHMARHDALTDLPNRVLFRDRLIEALVDVQRGAQLAVLYLDLDRFKAVNDTLGHQKGDDLLKVVAARLRRCLRETDTVARVGGDEFAIIQVGIGQPLDAAMLARRVCEAIRAPCDVSGHAVLVDTSIGVAVAPNDGSAPDELLKAADMALYGAKADGRGTYRFFEPAMDKRMKERRELEIALRQALTGGEFELHYQPLVHVDDRRITGCEALLRWNHPERGFIPPSEFVPVAEEVGLIVPLGEWVLRKACVEAALWPADIKVAVNLSAIQVMSQNLVPVVINALAAGGLPANRLEIEVTETVLMQNTEMTMATLHRLRELGVRISMDDFGTGYSSLSYLRKFPFDKIKIDSSFISGLPNDNDSIAIVRAVAGLAASLHMTATAEGVENHAQLTRIRELGCVEMQGHLFSPPRPLAQLMNLFAPYRATALAKSA
jgi:diguanylate cyclase (GGDEF)-like protein/PAS domain S-box-containing protein